jgi:hypothetical protein
MRIGSIIRCLALSSVLASTFGCISASTKYDRVAEDNGLNRLVTSGRGFQHVIYEKPGTMLRTGSLNVYIGSDGTPWNFNVPSEDPTPRNPMTLRLMLQDLQPAILVGRPCYHGLSRSQGCDHSVWTSARYSRKAVESIASVIEQYLDRHSYRSITLIGYSGGGALATLLAARLKQVDMVLTVAANLDTDAWVSHHNYEPLSASVNPAEEPPLPESIRQVHYFGTLDSVVPMSTTDGYFLVNNAAERHEIADFDHVCCWEEMWQSLLPAAE